jgi:Mlc titration factor MtfA (ptsG expression regulator)
MTRNYLALRRGSSQARKVLRRYGATNEAEFFAVATEAFFEKPRQMRKQTPDLYAALEQFYRRGPALED